MIDQLVLIGPRAPSILLPTAEETKYINEFSEDSEFLVDLQKFVAMRIEKTSRAVGSTWHHVHEIFEYTQARFDDYVCGFSEDYKPWTPLSSQPTLIARAFGFNTSLSEFVRNGFGSSVDPVFSDSIAALSPHIDIHDFLFKAFIINIEAVKFAQLAKTVDEFKKIDIGYLSDGISFSIDEKKNFTHTFIWHNNTFKMQFTQVSPELIDQYFISLQSNQIPYFIDCIEKNEIERGHHWSEIYIDHFSSTPRMQYIEAIRRKYLKTYIEFVNQFEINWDKEQYLYYIGKTPSISRGLETKIFDNIVRLMKEREESKNNILETASYNGRVESVPVSERLAKLDAFAANNPGQPVSGLVLELFPVIMSEQKSISLPTMAPDLWPDDRQEIDGKIENPPQFIKRVYGEWEGQGLSKKLIRSLDPTLYRALYNWLQRGNEMPADLDLPTIEEQNDRMVQRMVSEGDGQFAAREAMREAERLRSALRKRVKE